MYLSAYFLGKVCVPPFFSSLRCSSLMSLNLYITVYSSNSEVCIFQVVYRRVLSSKFNKKIDKEMEM